MISKFDLDTATGDQLDIIGQWIGITRDVAVPITGVFFSWDGTDVSLGWDAGVWQGATEITQLTDEFYRTLLKAKIAANHWDGTTEGAYAVFAIIFPDNLILIQDNQDMTYNLVIFGDLSALNEVLITQGYIPLKPEGVRVRTYIFPFDTGPIFAWDTESSFLQGWNEGAWAYEVDPV